MNLFKKPKQYTVSEIINLCRRWEETRKTLDYKVFHFGEPATDNIRLENLLNDGYVIDLQYPGPTGIVMVLCKITPPRVEGRDEKWYNSINK